MSFSAVSYEVSLPLSKGRILTPWACRQAGSLGYPRGDSRGVAELRILMISALEVWPLAGQGGAASLYKTLEAYGRRGHQVDFVSATMGANHPFGAPPQPPPAIEGVAYHLFHPPSLLEPR